MLQRLTRQPVSCSRIGVQLRANDEIDRKVVRNPGRALELASLEWRRLVGIVLDGLKQVFFNFGGTADKLSGPVAIVAVSIIGLGGFFKVQYRVRSYPRSCV